MGNAARSGTFRRSLRRVFCIQRRFDLAVRNSENAARKQIESGFCSYDLVSAGCRTIRQADTFLSLERRVCDCVLRVNLAAVQCACFYVD